MTSPARGISLCQTRAFFCIPIVVKREMRESVMTNQILNRC